MEETALLKLPYIMPSQAQKHVTHNEAIRSLDALVQLGILDRDLAEPPATPAEGDRYIVAVGATGAWSGHEGSVAAWQDGAWTIHAPVAGWLAWLLDEDALLCWDGTGWIAAAPPASLNPVPFLGLNATADETNRLSVSAEATLLNHEGAGHQLKINKADETDTGSLLFQTGWSGRAEMGLAGEDNFSVKVSADGSVWKQAMVMNRSTGAVTLPNTSLSAGSTDGQIQYRSGAGFAADSLFSYNSATSELSIGTTTRNGAITARGLGGKPSLYMTSDLTYCYLAMQHGSSWLNTSAGTQVFRTRHDGSLVFDWTREGTGGTDIGFHISSDRRARIGNGAATSQSRLEIDGPTKVGAYTVATLPSASDAGSGAIIFVSDESGGAVPAFSDGTDWRRITDRAVVS